MDESMKNKGMIREELTEPLETYYNGSFPQMVCDYIRSSGMTPEEVEELLETMKEFLGESLSVSHIKV